MEEWQSMQSAVGSLIGTSAPNAGPAKKTPVPTGLVNQRKDMRASGTEGKRIGRKVTTFPPRTVKAEPAEPGTPGTGMSGECRGVASPLAACTRFTSCNSHAICEKVLLSMA